MFFWILLGVVGVCALIPMIVFVFCVASGDFDGFFGALGGGLLMAALPSLPLSGIWGNHAADLGTIVAQQEIIAVYEKQRDDLNKTMTSFDYPAGSPLNADSPIRSIVEQLANVEKLLADSRAEKAEAIKSIEQRRLGPVSGVIRFAGDYK
jgi:hypothetical protein